MTKLRWFSFTFIWADMVKGLAPNLTIIIFLRNGGEIYTQLSKYLNKLCCWYLALVAVTRLPLFQTDVWQKYKILMLKWNQKINSCTKAYIDVTLITFSSFNYKASFNETVYKWSVWIVQKHVWSCPWLLCCHPGFLNISDEFEEVGIPIIAFF